MCFNTTMRLYLDDLRVTGARTREGTGVHWERTYNYFDTIERLSQGDITHISLDHDLNADEYLDIAQTGTGYDVACWIEAQAAACRLAPLTWEVHSMNPIGAARIRQAMESAERFWSLRPANG